MITIKHDGPYSYVYHPPTETECNRFVRKGYTPPDLVREGNPDVYRYARCEVPPNHPMPAVVHSVTIQPDYVAVYGKYTVSFACWYKKPEPYSRFFD